MAYEVAAAGQVALEGHEVGVVHGAIRELEAFLELLDGQAPGGGVRGKTRRGRFAFAVSDAGHANQD